ncbi:hypothetical protein GCM10022279_01760 [Comamonas faecalis]|uniref:Glycosyltransferase 61 catalytic domain-containing protein n=2 Tax=Comamonas faecalis TaxID=1387849 RepID=A0ABP7QGA2_9BURK
MVEVYRHGSTFDLGEQYIYDARWKFNKNIAHLIHHHLTRLGFFKKTIGIDAGDIKVILNAEKNSLAENIFNNFGYEVVRTDRKVAGNIVVFSGGEFFNILEYIENLKFCGVVGNMPENIYIPRKSTRKIKNSDDVSSLMRERGYVELFFEDLSIAEQWSAMKNARNIVAIHGAALGWLAFSCRRPDGIKANLIELFPAGFVVNPYRKYMAALGGAWAGCRGQITKEVVMDLDFGGELKSRAFDDFYISPESIEAALDQVKG